MPARIQGYKLGIGIPKQANISTIATVATAFQTFRKLDMEVPTLRYGTETDKDEIGKGNEFISQVFPTAWDVGGRLDKYGSAEFTLWAWAYALGNVVYGSPGPASTYTINPIDPGITLELPYFSLAAQLAEGGGNAIDEAYIGNAIEDVETTFKYGAGRSSVKTSVNWVGSGHHVLPSGVTFPAALAENYMLSSSAAITINTVNYVTSKTILQGTIGWKNNLILPMGFYPGSTLDGLAAVRGRLLIGNRVPTLTFTVFLQHDSTEYTQLVAQSPAGTAVFTLQYDATHFVTWTWHKVTFEMVERVTEEGFIAVTVTCAPQYDSSLGVVTVTGECALSNIAQ